MLACIAFRKRSHSEISTHKRAAGQTTCTRTGDLPHALVSRARPVCEGHKPNCGHERTGEVGLCRSTSEPAEQRRATFRGGRGGKGTDRGEHCSITHATDTERETHVPGIAWCAASSKRKEAGTVHRAAPPPERRIPPR